MVRRERVTEQREKMRGGEGTVTMEHWLAAEEKCPNLRLAASLVLPEGASIGEHVHEGETEIFFVKEGVAEYGDNGETKRAKAGDVMVCYGGERHFVRSAGPGRLVLEAVIVTG